MHENCMVLNGVFMASVGLNINTEYYKLKSTGSDLDRVSSDRSRLTGSEPIHPYPKLSVRTVEGLILNKT